MKTFFLQQNIKSIYTTSITFCLVAVSAILPLCVFAQGAVSLPVATTLEINNAQTTGGEVVLYDEQKNVYAIAQDAKDARVYGVTAIRPTLVFATASGTIPVVTAGATSVRVNSRNGAIERGDLLQSSGILGVAMRADLEDDAVFAIALESFEGTAVDSSQQGSIIAEIGVDQAHALQESRREIERLNTEAAAATTTGKDTLVVSFIRGAIAATVAVGALFFILYSFRSTIAKGVVSIGRNPRARTSIMTLAFGNIVFALILCAVALFVAVGILVLPV